MKCKCNNSMIAHRRGNNIDKISNLLSIKILRYRDEVCMQCLSWVCFLFGKQKILWTNTWGRSKLYELSKRNASDLNVRKTSKTSVYLKSIFIQKAIFHRMVEVIFEGKQKYKLTSIKERCKWKNIIKVKKKECIEIEVKFYLKWK